jgi:hypothetical protein
LRLALRPRVFVRHRALSAAFVTIVLAALAVAPAFAATEPAAGSFSEGPETITSAKFADGNEIYTLTREAVFTGTYAGVGQVDQRIVIHKDGSFNVNMTIAFTGLACGHPAVLTFRVSGQGSFVTNDFTGSYSVVGPAEVGKGQGTFSATPGVGGAYSGQAHCD